MDTGDRQIIRELARRVAEVAAKPIQQQRIDRWKRHNSLQSTEPMMLFFPEGSWQELIPAASLQCAGEAARGIEFGLRSRLYTDAHFADDTVIVAEWPVGPALKQTGWGMERRHIASTEARGAWKFDPVLKTKVDLDKLTLPSVEHDEAETARRLAEAEELLGDLLTVSCKGVNHISYHIMNWYTGLRGLEEAMVDMIADPPFIKAALALYEAGNRRLLEQYVELGLLGLNNDNTYQSSGGNGWSDELPAAGFTGTVRPTDMWASAESQEMAQVSPKMHAEFCLEYEQRLLAPFGLTGYGCCEDLTHKLADVTAVPNMRRLSISPWANLEACAEQLQANYIFSWKPNPSMLVGDFDEGVLRRYLRHALAATRGCVLEIVLKDTHTCEQRPERFDRWAAICREEMARQG